jgi:hypothetical protein
LTTERASDRNGSCAGSVALSSLTSRAAASRSTSRYASRPANAAARVGVGARRELRRDAVQALLCGAQLLRARGLVGHFVPRTSPSGESVGKRELSGKPCDEALSESAKQDS